MCTHMTKWVFCLCVSTPQQEMAFSCGRGAGSVRRVDVKTLWVQVCIENGRTSVAKRTQHWSPGCSSFSPGQSEVRVHVSSLMANLLSEVNKDRDFATVFRFCDAARFLLLLLLVALGASTVMRQTEKFKLCGPHTRIRINPYKKCTKMRLRYAKLLVSVLENFCFQQFICFVNWIPLLLVTMSQPISRCWT